MPVTSADSSSSTPSLASAAASSDAPSSAKQGGSVIVTGIARDVKGGAAIVADDGELTRIDGLDRWPPELADRRVVAEGTMKKRPGAACVNDPLPCQGIGDDHWVLAAARYRLE